MVAKKMNKIFLSASIPLAERDKLFFDTADIIAIRDSVRALASVVIPKANLVWGGHPSINPLIRYVLERMSANVKEHVTLYLSRFFEKQFPEDVMDFENVILTDAAESREQSLLKMRRRMFEENKFKAAFFVGGMEGVIDEFELFKEFHPDALCIPVASTGAAAGVLYNNYQINQNIRLLDDYAYMALFRDLLGDIIK